MSKESEVQKLLAEGNFRQAKKMLQKLHDTSVKVVDKIYYQAEIENAEDNAQLVSRLSVGEAFFPVFDEAKKRGRVLTLKIINRSGKESNNYLSEQYAYASSAVGKFLSSILKKEIQTAYVFDWGLDNYFFEIENLPEDLIKKLGGKSLHLALAMALISWIIKKAVPDLFAFSAALSDINEEIKLGEVGHIKEKTQVLLKERPKVKKFISCTAKKKIQSEISCFKQNLYDVCRMVFPKLKNELSELLISNNNSEMRKIWVRLLPNIKTTDGSCGYALFHHDNLKTNDSYGVFEFLKMNFQRLVNASKGGLIISGLRLSYTAPMLLALLSNQVRGFVALRYTQGDVHKIIIDDLKKKMKKEPDAMAYVVLTSRSGSIKEPGELILYYRPKEEKS